METARIGLFTAMPAVGSLLLQVPISSLSDRHDRRRVGVFTAAAASAATVLLLIGQVGQPLSYIAMVLLGGTMYPLYSIAGAYTNDRLRPELLTAAAAQLVVLFGVGAFIGPLVMAASMGLFGVNAYPASAAIGLGLISLFLLVRIIQHPSAERATPEKDVALDTQVLQIPATAVAMGRRLRYRRPVRSSGAR
jgi:MFS family permease